KEFDKRGWPKVLKTVKGKAVELSTSFTVNAARKPETKKTTAGSNAAAQPAKRTAKDKANASEAAAVAAIKRLGGRVTFDTKNPDRPATDLRLDRPHFIDAHLVHLKGLTNLQTLHLTNSRVTDAGLVHLKGLSKLQVLELNGTKVTDAGLIHVKGLKNLKRLGLTYTPITDAGLVHVEGMTSLEVLALAYTKVTDAGMEHLYGLPKLQTLYLAKTKVTRAGVIALQTALPNCNIGHQWALQNRPVPMKRPGFRRPRKSTPGKKKSIKKPALQAQVQGIDSRTQLVSRP
ncbi:MAG: hypothetical protein IID46_15595, partial [Planctomycetes bacterium]|nr:hypothetical protein [Planctomycetota bacterium]